MVENTHCFLRIKKQKIHEIALKILRDQNVTDSRINIILVDDLFIKRLNRRFRGRNRATDVLAFEFREKDFLGEIYISLDRARKQAVDMGHAFSVEVLRLVVHGLFHLSGYDHKTAGDAGRMERKERKYFTEIKCVE
jgi:probable rRNA maturation factor